MPTRVPAYDAFATGLKACDNRTKWKLKDIRIHMAKRLIHEEVVATKHKCDKIEYFG